MELHTQMELPMTCRLLIFSALLAGCDAATNSKYPGEPVAHMKGQMALASPDVSLTAPVKLAIVWFPTAPSQPGVPPAAVITSEVVYQGSFPQSFTFELYGAPPADAVTILNGHRVASGALVAYEDLDGDGELTLSTGPAVVDKVLATSYPAYDLLATFGIPAGLALVVITYSDGDLPDAVPGLDIPAGYAQLVLERSANGNGTATVKGISTPVMLTLRDDPRLNLAACAPAYGPSPVVTACGIREIDHATVSGSIIVDQTSPWATFTVSVTEGVDGANISDARLTLNGVGVPYDASLQIFDVTETTPSIIRLDAPNQLHVEMSEFPPYDESITVPGPFSISGPSDCSQLHEGDLVTVSWTASAGAGLYGATISPGADGAQYTAHSTTDTSTQFKLPSTAGPLEISLTAFSANGPPTLLTAQRGMTATCTVVP
jgi:hypothetical protein